MNNNYWYSGAAGRYGGSPEGYILDDQLAWIERELAAAERNATVRYVLLYAQEPVFPCGGHPGDAMWYHGNNNVRAHTFHDGKLEPEPLGIVEVRNRLAGAVGRSTKLAAVLGADEHAYYRVLIDRSVPVGVPARDDKNGDGVIAWRDAEPASPLAELKHPTWYVTCGGGGAPYYSEQATPWTVYWGEQADPRRGFYYSSQENLLLFTADGEKISLRVVNPYGETIDEIENLMGGR
jgi:hypothetical protein